MELRDTPLYVAREQNDIGVLPGMANRHGLIAGATGTGKTVTLRVLAEQFSRIGVPVFLADVKGDLASICRPGGDHPKVAERVKTLGLDPFQYQAYPTVFWDVWGEKGHPVRTTVSEMGPLLLSRLLGLNETQSDVLTMVFRIADDERLMLLDMKDLRSMLAFVSENAREFTDYGRISAASVGAIMRRLLALEEEGGDKLFGEPALNLDDMLQTDEDGRGIINILAAEKLFLAPKVYATFLLWMLSEFFENLGEVGDPEKPRLVFFFDEAHLLFEDTPKHLVDKIEQIVRLIRSKGVGVYFITQSPTDLPDDVLGQLGNRVQHALRAYTPREQKAVRAAAETFRVNPDLDVESAITQLGVGEGLVSFLEKKGVPGMVRRALIYPPQSMLGLLDNAERRQVIRTSLLYGTYEKELDRESAYELLLERKEKEQEERERREKAALEEKEERERAKLAAQKAKQEARASGRGRSRQSFAEAFAKSALRSVGSQIGTRLMRGILKSLLK